MKRRGVTIGPGAPSLLLVVVVVAMSVLGLLALPLLRAAGAIPIIAVDPVAEKRAKALSAGADAALDPFA